MFFARGKGSLTLVLRFSFCDDLFLTVICPSLPDDITGELLRIRFVAPDETLARAIVIVLTTFSDKLGLNYAITLSALTLNPGRKPRANLPPVGLPPANNANDS